jgi:hypothetical protein
VGLFPHIPAHFPVFDKCGNASTVSVAEVIEGFWRRYPVVLRVDPYYDGTELSQRFIENHASLQTRLTVRGGLVMFLS